MVTSSFARFHSHKKTKSSVINLRSHLCWLDFQSSNTTRHHLRSGVWLTCVYNWSVESPLYLTRPRNLTLGTLISFEVFWGITSSNFGINFECFLVNSKKGDRQQLSSHLFITPFPQTPPTPHPTPQKKYISFLETLAALCWRKNTSAAVWSYRMFGF